MVNLSALRLLMVQAHFTISQTNTLPADNFTRANSLKDSSSFKMETRMKENSRKGVPTDKALINQANLLLQMPVHNPARFCKII